MAEESISLSESELTLIRELTVSGVEFIIVGMSAALLQGVPAVTQDIDLWIKDLGSESFLSAIKKAGAIYIPPGLVDLIPPLLVGRDLRGLDLVTNCQGLNDFDLELKNAIKIRIRDIEVNVLPLERIILSKETAGRDKDLAVLPILKSALKVLRS